MAILIATDCQTKAARVRHHLTHGGYDCPLTNVVPIEAARQSISSLQPQPELIIFVLSHDDERALTVLRHLRDTVETPIVAIGPRDPSLILGTLHAGVSDYLDESGDLHNDLSSALARIFESASKRSTVGRLVTVVGTSGGSGRTLFATNLAVQLAKTEGRCGLFDFDLIGADVATSLNLKPRHTITDLCQQIDKLDQKMFEQSLVEHPSGAFVLAAPEVWDESRLISPEGLQKVIRFGKALFPTVVADLNFHSLKEYVHVLQQSTVVFVLLRLDFPGIRNADRTLTALDRAGVDQSKARLVAVRYGRPKEIGAAQAESVLGTKIRHYLPEDAHTVNACVNCGVSVVLEAPTSAIAKAIAGIAKTITDGNSGQNGAHAPQASDHRLQIVERMRSFLKFRGAGFAHHA